MGFVVVEHERYDWGSKWGVNTPEGSPVKADDLFTVLSDDEILNCTDSFGNYLTTSRNSADELAQRLTDLSTLAASNLNAQGRIIHSEDWV